MQKMIGVSACWTNRAVVGRHCGCWREVDDTTAQKRSLFHFAQMRAFSARDFDDVRRQPIATLKSVATTAT
jgi:hypothetical protein